MTEPHCRGLSTLFDATDPTSHAEAKAICNGCPLLDWCRHEVTTVDHPIGTWAGKLFLENNGHKPRMVTCIVCSTEFLANHAAAKCCTEQCRRKRARVHQKEHDARRRGTALPLPKKEKQPRGTGRPAGRPETPLTLTEPERRGLHNAYMKGDRSPATVRGEREYQRENKRAARERKTA